MQRNKLTWLIIATLPLHAQEARSTILGRITDPTGSLIVGATVEATNTDTGVRSTAQTNGNGDFLFAYINSELHKRQPVSYMSMNESVKHKQYSEQLAGV